MTDFSKPGRILITCNRGLAPALTLEQAEFGIKPEETLHTGVSIVGTLEDCIALNLRLRTASQVLYSLRDFPCNNPDQLYRAINTIRWEEILPCDGYFTVSSNVFHDTIRSGMFANVKVKDAIVDRMRKATGERPDSGAELLGAVVYLFWRNDKAEVFLDTSGDTLAKHGYRKRPGKAPMVEALAAGIVLSSRWDRKQAFVNPMCGSGTLAIEAALIATGRRPSLLREGYAMEHIVGFDAKAFKRERRFVADEVRTRTDLKIIATDISREAIEISKANAAVAGVADLIEFKVCDFGDTPLPDGGGVVVFNPEYGERLGEEDQLREVYSRIGDYLKQKCGGYWGYVFTGNLELAKSIGLKTKRRMEFSTASLDCRLLEYELYAGTRKHPSRTTEAEAIPEIVESVEQKVDVTESSEATPNESHP
ncbi:MAG: hypothetical protein U0892_10230 [Pirellulales bacterium]